MPTGADPILWPKSFAISLSFLPPANEVWGKVIFSETCVKNSVHGGGGLSQYMLGYHTPPDQAGTPPPKDQAPPRPGTPQDQAAPQSPQDQAGTPPGAGTPWDQAPLPPEQSMLGDMVNEWPVCILLVCNLVWHKVSLKKSPVGHNLLYNYKNSTILCALFLTVKCLCFFLNLIQKMFIIDVDVANTTYQGEYSQASC